ncbi:MAG: hypothetical protein ACLRP8_13465 [Roseburia intestinalis]
MDTLAKKNGEEVMKLILDYYYHERQTGKDILLFCVCQSARMQNISRDGVRDRPASALRWAACLQVGTP